MNKKIFVSPHYLAILSMVLSQGLHPVNVMSFESFADFLNHVKFRLKEQDRIGALDALVSEEVRMMDLAQEEVFHVSNP